MAANLTKLVHGAWLPLLIAITTFTVMLTWQRGSTIVSRRREVAEGPLDGASPAQMVTVSGLT